MARDQITIDRATAERLLDSVAEFRLSEWMSNGGCGLAHQLAHELCTNYGVPLKVVEAKRLGELFTAELGGAWLKRSLASFLVFVSVEGQDKKTDVIGALLNT